MNKICLTATMLVALALATAGCKTTKTAYDGSYPNVGVGEIVPMIKWGF